MAILRRFRFRFCGRSTLLGDVDGDGCVGTADIALVTACIGKPILGACSMSYLADQDGNGSVDIRDYLKVVSNQGKGCVGRVLE